MLMRKSEEYVCNLVPLNLPPRYSEGKSKIVGKC